MVGLFVEHATGVTGVSSATGRTGVMLLLEGSFMSENGPWTCLR